MLNEKEQEEVLGMCKDLFRDIEAILEKPKAEPEQLTTPPGIKFMVNSYDQVIGLLFNDKQVLEYSLTGIFTVSAYSSYIGDPVEGLPLTPCKYGDLKAGEFTLSLSTGSAVCSLEDGAKRIQVYEMHLPEGRCVSIDENSKFPKPRAFINHHVNIWKVGK